MYDCNKTIWILATNLGENDIHRFSKSAHSRSRKPNSSDVTRLQAEIRDVFLTQFGVGHFFRFLLNSPSVIFFTRFDIAILKM